MPHPHILVVNPGSTSTKMGIARGDVIIESETLLHSSAELGQHARIWDQFSFRTAICREWARVRRTGYDAVVAIGGLFRPLKGGTYRVNDAMLADARANLQGEHASNLGCAIANDLAREFGSPAFVVDPVSVDELGPLAHFSGHPGIERRSLSHALNLHATARQAAGLAGVPFGQSSLIVAHLGGGISIAPVAGGRIIDVNDASSDGPFSPERTGGLPLQPLIGLCFSGKMREPEVRAMVMGKGGLVAYLGTNSAMETEQRIKGGDTLAKDVFQAMAYQIAKEIGAMATVLMGKVDAIAITGGLARSEMLTSWIEERVRFIAPVHVIPGEHEMAALASGAARILRGEEQEERY
jgi:butyrate kinase